MLCAVGIFIIHIKEKTQIIPLASVMIMLGIDAIIIYLFYKLNVDKEDIAFGILMATILKVFMFSFSTKIQ
jgi:hypothetical protein